MKKKWAYFKELSNPKFFEPFMKKNVLNFKDNATKQVINYLLKIYSNEIKDKILELINNNLEEALTFAYGNVYCVTELLNKFPIMDIQKKITNIKILFKNSNSLCLCEYFLKRKDILQGKHLCKLCIETLTDYKILDSKNIDGSVKREPITIHDKFLLDEVLTKEATKDILVNIIKQKNNLEFLFEKYIEITNKVGDISCFHRQNIDCNVVREDDYPSSYCDARDIILNFIIYYIEVNSLSNKQLTFLLKSNKIMFYKLVLYVIKKDLNKNVSSFISFIKNIIHMENFEEILYACKYELISLFESLSLDESSYNEESLKEIRNNNKQINEVINQIFNKIENLNLKYNLLHGLKSYQEFKNEFEKLKKENFNNKEQSHPKLFFYSSGGFKSITNTSPISKEDFLKKSIAQQIEYLNEFDSNARKIVEENDETCVEENITGLASLFKEILNEKFEEYIYSLEIKNLKKYEIVSSLFESIENYVKNKRPLKLQKILTLLEYYINNINNFAGDSGNFHYCLHELLSAIINYKITPKTNSKKLYKIITFLIDSNWNYQTENENIAFLAINTPVGRYVENLINLLIRSKSIDTEQLEYIKCKVQSSEICKAQKFLIYHLGCNYDYIYYHVSKKVFNNIIKKFNNTQISYFIGGFLSFNRYIQVTKHFNKLILKCFKNNIIEDKIRNRFVQLLTSARFDLDEIEFFNEYKKYFTSDDKETVLSNIIHKKQKDLYNKEKVFMFLEEEIDNSSYPDLLLKIIAIYHEKGDCEKYYSSIRKILNLYINLKREFCYEFYLSSFLNSVLMDLKLVNKSSSVLKKYHNIIDDVIKIIPYYDHLFKIPEILLLLIEELQAKGESINVLVNKIYTTKGLISHSHLFRKFRIDKE